MAQESDWVDQASSDLRVLDDPNRDGWLLAAGLLYPLVTIGVMVGLGPLAFHPLLIPLPAIALAVIVIWCWLGGAKLRGLSVALFVGWLMVVVLLQWLVLASASAAV